MLWTRTAVRTAAFVLAAVWTVSSVAEEPLPSDPRIKTGTLGNGLKWMYRQHDNPPGKMALMIHVDSGSLNEEDAQRGLAHFIEHMSFNGSENFAPGALIPYFESIGMQFGPDLNAFTGFDQTAYMLFLPDTQVETVDKGLMVLSDYAFRLLLLEEEIEKERGVILSELTAGMGPQQRLRDKFFERVFAGTRLAERVPIGIAEVIRGAGRGMFVDYYRTWYRPENVTLMLVGDAAPEAYLPAIEKWFGQYRPEVPARPQASADLKPFVQTRAIVLTDPEFTQGDVQFYGMESGRPPITTVERARVELIDEIGSWLIGRRFDERVKKGEAAYRNAYAGVSPLFEEGMLVVGGATGEPQDWEKMLEQLVTEVNRAREHGFLAPEFELARKELLAGAEREVETEPTQNARGLIFRMASAVNDKEPLMSAQQYLELMQRLLPTVTPAEINAAFKAHFAPGTFAYVLRMPEKEGVAVPAEDAVLAAAKAAEARQTTAWEWEERPTELLTAEPVPGKVVESALDEDLGITSAWLSNGVRLHHRYMDYKKDSVWVSVTLAGGQIEETAANAGVTTIAALLLDQPATQRLRSTDIVDIMTGRKVSVGGDARNDTFSITVSGSPADLEIGLQLVHALLTEGKLEQSAFDTWKQAALQQYAALIHQPRFIAIDKLMRITSGDDPRRVMLMPPELIEAQSVARSQAWFERLCRTAPIEVAVVGDMQLAAAAPLIEKYIGSLAARPRQATHLDALRQVARGDGPYTERMPVDTVTPSDMVIYGFIGCNVQDTADMRALNLAALTLDSRLIKRVREELGLVYSIGANSMPSGAYTDGGLFVSAAPSREPGKGDETAAEIAALYRAFAQDGPTAEELAVAKKQIANELDTQLKEPSFWFEQLSNLDLHKLRLSDLKNIEASYEAFTAEQVRAAFTKYFTPARTFDVIAAPSSTLEPQTEKADAAAKP